ncbi:protein disulfide isomerase EPS1 [Sugiyamaella lignohabitans]|uniref:Protein disulfide isomerase EPS1 n=1 Tax=Sugiyamaella lignohabitans TaxID=796027 RepID=A0A167FWW9_9ASCO|nr:protein disulfide isomerase EPS1 [Sugiyamaella lignohabitans]ANB15805.1 protein disulfide isomerase EPS1 [Sugiyamaella lignohabitans]
MIALLKMKPLMAYVVTFCVLISLTTAAPAEKNKKPVDGPNSPVYLSKQNFTSTIENGTWWVDFFSPYCPHCIALAPDWTKAWDLLNEEEDVEELYDFHMAKVDCVEQGDLCNDQDIGGYPNLRLFRNGKNIKQYLDGDRTPEALVKFARDNFLDTPESSSLSYSKTTQATATGADARNVKATSSVSRAFPQYTGGTAVVNSVFPGSVKETGSPAGPTFPEGAPNPEGISVPLDHTSFIRKVTATTDSWFIKFYSPRCPHCNDMKPAWMEMAHALRGKINVGEVNCDTQRQLCKDVGIDALPGLFHFSGTTKTPYNSLRGFSDLLDFAKGAAEAKDLATVNTFQELGSIVDETKDKATFVYFYDKTTVSEDFEAMRRVALNTLDYSRIYKSNSTELATKLGVKHFPSLYAVSDTETAKWIELVAPSPKDIRDHQHISNWIKEIWLSFVPQLTPMNAQDIFDHAEYVVLAMIDPRDTKVRDRAINELRVSAQKYLDDVKKETLEELMDLRAKKQLKIDEAADRDDKKAEDHAKGIKVKVTPKPVVGFAWIDSVFWNRYLRTKYGISTDRIGKPTVIINDKTGSRYWDTNLSGQPIEASRSIIIETLEAILESPQKIRPKVVITGVSSFIWFVRLKISQHWFASSALVVALFIYVAKKRQGHTGELYLPLHHNRHQPTTGKLD